MFLLTVDQVAAILSLSKKTIYKLSESGILPRVRIGRAVRFDPADVQALIEAGRQRRTERE